MAVRTDYSGHGYRLACRVMLGVPVTGSISMPLCADGPGDLLTRSQPALYRGMLWRQWVAAGEAQLPDSFAGGPGIERDRVVHGASGRAQPTLVATPIRT